MSRTPMKLILTQEVSGLGAPGDVVDVAAGYGRNYLIPRGFAMCWTRGAEKQVDLIERARSVREIRGLEDAKVVAGSSRSCDVRMRRRPAANGRLFGSVGPADIAAAVREAGGPSSTGAGSRFATRSRPGLAPGPGAAAPRGQRAGRHRDLGRLVPLRPLPGRARSLCFMITKASGRSTTRSLRDHGCHSADSRPAALVGRRM